MLRLIIAICLTATAAVSAQDGITVSQSLSHDRIAYEDSVRLDITVAWDGPQSAYFFDRPLQPVLQNLSIRGYSSSIKTTGQPPTETTTKRFSLVLIPNGDGNGLIEPITISYLQWPDSIPGQLLTEGLSVTIATPKPVKSSSSDWPWMTTVIVGVGLVLVAGLVVWYRRRQQMPTEDIALPRDAFLSCLSNLQKETGNDLKKFQQGLFTALAHLLQQQFGISPDQSTGGLAQRLTEAGLSMEDAELLTQAYVEADKDRYRPVTAGPGEVIRRAADIRGIIEKML